MSEEQKIAELNHTIENVKAMLHYRDYAGVEAIQLKNLTGLFATNTRGQPVLCVIATTKVTPKDVFQNVKQVAKDYKHIIIVHEHQQSKTIRSHFGSMEGAKFIETIHFDQFIINKAEHFGTEKSKIVPADDEDFANFIRISGLQLSQLPVKRTQDPMMVWLGAQHGDIILTTRLYHSITKQHIYEFVSNDAGKADDADSDED